MQNNRFIMAFMIAPVSFGLLLWLISMFTGKPAEGFFMLMFVAYIGYPVALIVGLPLFALFRYMRWNGLTAYAISSVAFSALLIFLFITEPMRQQGQSLEDLLHPTRLSQMSIIAFACVVTVLSFWLIARPDRN